jgi:hypothetical protein
LWVGNVCDDVKKNRIKLAGFTLQKRGSLASCNSLYFFNDKCIVSASVRDLSVRRVGFNCGFLVGFSSPTSIYVKAVN